MNVHLLAAPVRPDVDCGLSPLVLGRAATSALFDELVLYPKPGLVSFVDSGSHTDMNAHTFMRSIFSLSGYFDRITALGAARAAFCDLEACGQEAEVQMAVATGGVNTHRGAIFMLGLLCAGAAAALQRTRHLSVSQIRNALLDNWGVALAARALRPALLPGGVAARRYGLRSASAEAALGFPVLWETAVPALASALAAGMPVRLARLDCLFHVIAVLDDCNLAHRGGMEGLRFAQDAARRFLDAGGASREGGEEAARTIHQDFIRRRLSPGGSADVLAAACWMERISRAGAASA
ncbi:MAG: triphosphoribosyl-dephospho-CoA synthase [Pseudomonadota bacterium]